MSVDLAQLYSAKLLALTTQIPHQGRLDAPQASVRERAPLCGSTVTVDLDMENGRVARFAQDVKACALGQASAAVLGSVVIGRTVEELENARDQLAAFLKTAAPSPPRPLKGSKCCFPRAIMQTATPRSFCPSPPPPKPPVRQWRTPRRERSALAWQKAPPTLTVR